MRKQSTNTSVVLGFPFSGDFRGTQMLPAGILHFVESCHWQHELNYETVNKGPSRLSGCVQGCVRSESWNLDQKTLLKSLKRCKLGLSALSYAGKLADGPGAGQPLVKGCKSTQKRQRRGQYRLKVLGHHSVAKLA